MIKKFIINNDKKFFNGNIRKFYQYIYSNKKQRQGFIKNYYGKLNVNNYKLMHFWSLMFSKVMSNNVPGNIVECGVGNAVTLSKILFNLVYFEKNFIDKKFYYGFDSFEGYPEPSKFDKSFRDAKKGDWSHTNEKYVIQILSELGFSSNEIEKHLNFVVGFYDNTIPSFECGKLCLIHLDCDLYESTKISLNKFFPKLEKNGVIIFGGYHNQKQWPGMTKAIDEFFGDDAKLIKYDQISNKPYMIKI